MTTIRVYRPVFDEPPSAPVTLADRRSLNGARLALIDNGKPRAREIMRAIGEELRAAGVVDVEVISKPSAAAPLDDDEVDAVSARVDIVIAGMGDCGACSACSLHDALLFERNGVPSTVLITDVFTSHVARFAINLGAPGYHTLVVPHPVATRSAGQILALAASVKAAAVDQLSVVELAGSA